ncbi:SpoIID/LytB domain-containing protein [Cohnella nanjingensis]|uniref:SpoIID/LytB domain-containing protein n=1 Tax=Cohnella nanjingensis TaxID=1387779 RepID=A0A7X0RXN8_9BACL|nr:SpoIID/LytB domain-containing protein [Cohnella nanjingensis]MBB6674265.1 SpoIID/LytB domain-containing protein [Cohnella nanjingensis]
MTLIHRRKRLAAAMLAALALTTASAPVYGAVSVPDQIRVALFLDLGTKYQATTPSVTLVSAGGLSMSWGAGGSFSAPGGTARFAVDGYRAVVLETSDQAAATNALKKIQASSKAGFITKLSKKGKTVYQVYEGGFATAALAKSALSKWTSAGVAGGAATLTPAFVGGPFAVEAGPYASLSEAAAAAEQIGNVGLDAFAAVKPAPGGVDYVVRIGQAADAGEQSSLLQEASAAGFSVSRPSPNDPYAVIRNDVTASASGAAVPLYAMPAGADGALLAAPAGDTAIQVVERSKRTYRGGMEISVLNNNLAVVNVVGLEQYLYAVVGTEVPATWPVEAQKAQAVAARSYALSMGNQYQVAQVVDSTYSQAYNGISAENPGSIAGVQATAGEVMTSGGKIINAVFSANAGGITADPVEIWGNATPYLASAAQSPDDGPQQGKPDWYRVALDTGEVGYIRSDMAADQGQKNAAGLKVLQVTASDVAIRKIPLVQNDVNPIARVSTGTTVVLLDKVPEYTNYSWIEGPYTGEQLLTTLNGKLGAGNKIQGPLQTLEVSESGASGRAIRLAANGNPVATTGDNLRSALGGIKSTLFQIEETGRFTVLGANGAKRELPVQSGPLQVLGANGSTRSFDAGNALVLSGNGQVRAVTSQPQFIISGKGYGHGLGMSQWGAKAMADQGYDYQTILKYYYKNVALEKDGNG